jgi:large subunit ribosomal protein L22
MATVETPEIEFRAEARYVRTAPRKAQLVVAEIRNLRATEARTALRFMTRAAAEDVRRVLDSAIANAESHPRSSYDVESLYVSAAYVGEGPTLKRWQARARGRVGRIRKRTCHITVRLAPIPGATAVRPATQADEPRRGRKPRAETAVAQAAVEAPESVEVEAPESVEVEAPESVEVEAAPSGEDIERGEAGAAEPAGPEPTGDASPAEAKPKRTRARKPPAEPSSEAETAAEEAPKPRRTRKKAEETPEEEG